MKYTLTRANPEGAKGTYPMQTQQTVASHGSTDPMEDEVHKSVFMLLLFY